MLGRFKYYEMGNGSLSRCAAEGAILEICMARRMVVMQMRCGGGALERRTEFHQKWRPAGRHKPNGDIGTKYQRSQQNDGQHTGSLTVKTLRSHTCDGNAVRQRIIIPVDTGVPVFCYCWTWVAGELCQRHW